MGGVVNIMKWEDTKMPSINTNTKPIKGYDTDYFKKEVHRSTQNRKITMFSYGSCKHFWAVTAERKNKKRVLTFYKGLNEVKRSNVHTKILKHFGVL